MLAIIVNHEQKYIAHRDIGNAIATKTAIIDYLAAELKCDVKNFDEIIIVSGDKIVCHWILNM